MAESLTRRGGARTPDGADGSGHERARRGSANAVLLFHVLPSSDWFRATLTAVGRRFRFVSLEDLDRHFYEDHPLVGSCHVSFDDGDRTFLDLGVPVLREMQIPSSLYVSPEIILGARNYWFQDLESLLSQGAEGSVRAEIARALGCSPTAIEQFSPFDLCKCLPIRKIEELLAEVQSQTGRRVIRRYNLEPSELLELRDSGLVAIGAHTQTHPILSSEAAEDSRAQIVDSIRELSEFVGQQVVAFAYPNGMAGLDFSDREKRTLEQCGIRLSFTTRTGFFERTTDPLEIPRIGFAGSRHETRAWIGGKLLLTPVWDRSRDLLTRTSHAKRRQEIGAVASETP